MATIREFLVRCEDGLLGPLEPIADDSESMVELQKELASSLTWSFQALLAASAFCAITAASHDDWNLLSQAGETELPLIGVKLAFLPFLLIAPLALLSMQVYLQIQAHALLRMPRASQNSLIRNHDQWWPISLLGFASYAFVPLVTLFLLWKIWPRSFSDDPVIFGDIHFHIGRAAVGAVLTLSCLASVRGALSDRRCLKQMDGHVTQRRFSWKFASCVVVVCCGISLWIGSLFAHRHLELLKAPLDGADLRSFDLSDADLQQARLKGALMEGAMLPNALLGGARLDGADLRGAQLTGADLSLSRLNDADLTGAVLVGANLWRVEAEGAHFDHAWMVGALFEPLPATPDDRTKTFLDPNRKKELTAADAAYARADMIETIGLSDAKLCAATITPGHWKDRAVQVGEIDVKSGSPFYYEGETRPIPDQLHAIPLPKAAQGAPGGSKGFLAERLETCFLKLKICDQDPYPALCNK